MRPTLIATPEVESILPSEVAVGFEILEQESFVRMLYLERKRTARTGRRFVLMLLESGSVLKASGDKDTLARVLRSVASATRDTDIKGWYKDGEIFGIIFTEIDTDGRLVGRALLSRFYTAITSTLSIEEINEISLSFHVFPEESSKGTLGTPNDPALYPELSPDEDQMKGARRLKRAMDIVGSLFALAVSTPVMIAIAAAIKLTSKGPVFFCQPRVGECGRCFTFLKFRTMLTGCDDSVHKEYVKSLIAANAASEPGLDGQPKVFKMTNDPRITPIGRFLRRSSLDELPQFFNVLVGDMSLVGPRPAIPYEVKNYDIWHRQRLLSVKPGITGIWQVEGRGRTRFCEMVRMDLKYARTWSCWLDLKILLATPRAVISGNGAY